jgi:hypothetical protein
MSSDHWRSVTDRQTDGQADMRTGGQADRWTDGQTDGQTTKQILAFIRL